MLDGWQEALEILNDEVLLQELRRSLEGAAGGDTVDWDTVRVDLGLSA